MTRLVQGSVWHLARPVGSLRRAWRPSIVGLSRGVEDKQIVSDSLYARFYICLQLEKKQPYTQNFPPNREKEEIFMSRMSKIWEGMMTFERAAEWNDIILSRKKDEWLSRITKHIPVDVKLMLVSPHPLTPAQIKSLPWSNTADGDVFAWCTEPNRKQNSTEKILHGYIGSASKFHGGLSFRKSHMLSRSTILHGGGLKFKFKDLDLNSEGEFKKVVHSSTREWL